MCGIVAVFNTKEPVNKNQLILATRALKHRGPDGEGFWFGEDNKVGLGHRRLSIIDPQGGKQPLLSKNVVATINGEFYDYKKIRSSLEQKGYFFQTQSDSEIVLYLYEEYGLDFVKYLRGEFAIIIYDKRKHQLIAARDRFGIKPLQYHLDARGNLSLASEAKALFALGVKAEWDAYSLYHACTLQYNPQDRTFFNTVQQLKPGHLLIYDGESLKIKKYWDLDFPKADKEIEAIDENEAARQLEAELAEAVSLRLQTDGARYCSHLSGGIDSGLIAALAAKLGKQKMHCFTISFPDKTYDETRLARILTKHIGAEFSAVEVNAKRIIDSLSQAIYFSEGLAINSHLSAKFILNEEIRRAGYKIALTGEGSDESLSGYIHFKADLEGGLLKSETGQNLIVSGIHLPKGKSLDLKFINKKLGYIPTFLQAKASIGYVLNNLFESSFKQRFSSSKIISDFANSVDIKNQLRDRSRLNQSTYLWIKFTLANYILKTLGDGTEMAWGIEGRVPFLDHKFFEFTKILPASLKIKGGVQKYILRKIASKYIPKEIYERPKQTFMAPPLSLFKDRRGLEFIVDSFSSQAFANMGIFNQKKTLRFADSLKGKTIEEQIALEPPIMLMLSIFLMHKNFKL